MHSFICRIFRHLLIPIQILMTQFWLIHFPFKIKRAEKPKGSYTKLSNESITFLVNNFSLILIWNSYLEFWMSYKTPSALSLPRSDFKSSFLLTLCLLSDSRTDSNTSLLLLNSVSLNPPAAHIHLTFFINDTALGRLGTDLRISSTSS